MPEHDASLDASMQDGSMSAVCGDGLVQSGESCDGPNLACHDLWPGFASGVASCDGCEWNLADCEPGDRCGDGVVDAGEDCDDGNHASGDGCSAACAEEAGEAHAGLCGDVGTGTSGLGYGLPDTLCLGGASPDDTWRVLRLRAHVLENSSGEAAASLAGIQETVLEANRLLEEHHLHLALISDLLHLQDDLYFDLDADNRHALFRVANDAHALDAYFVNSVRADRPACGVASQIGPGASDALAVARGCGGLTLAHEVGHLLGLWHTHHVQDGACDATGDACCDTAEDPGPPEARPEGPGTCSQTASECTATCDGGETPDPRNIMSYYHCRSSDALFTSCQSARMQCHLDRHFDHTLQRGCLDEDGDGYGEGDSCANDAADCDDSDPTQYPGRAESCNGLDDDCDGVIDEGVDPLREEVVDRCPTAGVCINAIQRCSGGTWVCDFPAEYRVTECPVSVSSCGIGDLADPSCSDGRDNDCDGVLDENNPIVECREDPTYDRVLRGDECFASTHGRCGSRGGTYECVALAEGCGVRVDCVGATFPEAERCDTEDWDCDGFVWDRRDRDGDGFGDCYGRADCDETNAAIYPGAAETCDGRDNDCDGEVDEAGALGCRSFYLDEDGDGIGTGTRRCLCAASGAYTAEVSGDCDDRDHRAFPGQTEWFTTPRPGGSFDFDCNGIEQRGFETVANCGTCGCPPFPSGCTRGEPGWSGSVPRCGERGLIAPCCGVMRSQTQSCR